MINGILVFSLSDLLRLRGKLSIYMRKALSSTTDIGDLAPWQVIYPDGPYRNLQEALLIAETWYDNYSRNYET